jgi:hypothetical protein
MHVAGIAGRSARRGFGRYFASSISARDIADIGIVELGELRDDAFFAPTSLVNSISWPAIGARGARSSDRGDDHRQLRQTPPLARAQIKQRGFLVPCRALVVRRLQVGAGGSRRPDTALPVVRELFAPCRVKAIAGTARLVALRDDRARAIS